MISRRILERVIVGVAVSLIMGGFVWVKKSFAYPAVSGCNVIATGGGAAGNYPSAGAFEAAWAAANPGSTLHYCTGPGPGPSCLPIRGAPVCPGPDMAYLVLETGGAFFAAGQVNSSPVGATCPNGGTLNGGGTACDCAAGQTDTGTACTGSPSTCPAGQYAPVGGGACQNICGAAGAPWSPLDTVGGAMADGMTYPSGKSTVCIEVGINNGPGVVVTDVCRVKPTGSVIVCSDGGGGVECFSETGRYTGDRCAPSPANNMPSNDPTTCSAGELWCKNTTGTCASGFTGGVYNGQSICTKVGSPVNVVPQPQSPLAPPVPADVTTPPTQTNAPGETNDPNTRTAVGVGPGATGVGGNPGGNGTGGNGEMKSCGLPDTPKCKIDEAGTPDGKGAYDAAAKKVDQHFADAKKGLETVTSTDGKDTSWGFSLSPPSTCIPLAVSFGPVNFNINPCPYQSVFHDIMSLLWAASTLFGILGMVRQTVTA